MSTKQERTLVFATLAGLTILYSGIASDFNHFHAFWSADSGARFAMIENGLRHGSLISMTYNNSALDPTGRLHPLQFYVMRGPKGFNVMYPPFFPWLCGLAFRLWGFDGLTLVPLASGLGTLWVTYLTAVRLGLRSGKFLPLAMGLATPLIVYSVVFWDHTLLMLLTAGAGYCWLRALQGQAETQEVETQEMVGQAERDNVAGAKATGKRGLGFALATGALLGAGVWIHELFLLLFTAIFLACLPLLNRVALRRLVAGLTLSFLFVLLLWAASNQAMYGSWAGPHLMANIGHHKVNDDYHNAGIKEAIDPRQIAARATLQLVGFPDPAGFPEPATVKARKGWAIVLLLVLGTIAFTARLQGVLTSASGPKLARFESSRTDPAPPPTLFIVASLNFAPSFYVFLYLLAAVIAALLLRCWVPASGLFQVSPLLVPALAASWYAASVGKGYKPEATDLENRVLENTHLETTDKGCAKDIPMPTPQIGTVFSGTANDQNAPTDRQNSPSDRKENQSMYAPPPLSRISKKSSFSRIFHHSRTFHPDVPPTAIFSAWIARVCALFALLVFVNPVLPGMDWGSRYLLTMLPFLVLLAAEVLERQYWNTPVGTRWAFLPGLCVVIGISLASQGYGLAAVRNDLLYSRDLNRKASALASATLVTDIYWLGPELTASALPQKQFLVRSEADRQLFLTAQAAPHTAQEQNFAQELAHNLESHAQTRKASDLQKGAGFTFMGTSEGLAALVKTISGSGSAFRPVATWNDVGLRFAHFVLADAPSPADMALALAKPQTPKAAAKAKHVLALYYPWYGTPARSGRWLHQEPDEIEMKKMADHAHFPSVGAYDSTDPAIIERHLSEAHAAGIDTLLCSWWGQADRTDIAIRMILRRAAAHSLKVCILWESPGTTSVPKTKDATGTDGLKTKNGPKTKSPKNISAAEPTFPPSVQAAKTDLLYLLNTLAKNPAYLQVGGKPVIFLYAGSSQALTTEQWATMARQAATQAPPGVQFIGSGRSPADVPHLGGLYTLNTIRSMAGISLADCAQIQRETFRPLIALANETGGISVETVLPGYDDRRADDATGMLAGTVADRQDGQLYGTLWDQAIQDGPDWVLVNSFNQWHNGTEIEPSVEMGDRYLAITRQFSLRFKKLPAISSQAMQP